MEKREKFVQEDLAFQKILQMSPGHSVCLLHYAEFLAEQRKDPNKAESYYKAALDSNPLHADTLISYALFLDKHKKDISKAHRFYKRAHFADRNNADIICHFAIFQEKTLKDFVETEKLYKMALEADCEHIPTLGSYASFLQHIKKDYAASEQHYQKVLEASRGKKKAYLYWKDRYSNLKRERSRSTSFRNLSAGSNSYWTEMASSSGRRARSVSEKIQRVNSPKSLDGKGDKGKNTEKVEEENGLISLRDKEFMELFIEDLFKSESTEWLGDLGRAEDKNKKKVWHIYFQQSDLCLCEVCLNYRLAGRTERAGQQNTWILFWHVALHELICIDFLTNKEPWWEFYFCI